MCEWEREKGVWVYVCVCVGGGGPKMNQPEEDQRTGKVASISIVDR